MALLSELKRKKYFHFLGYGEYTKENIKRFQEKYFSRKQDIDGIYGVNTDILLRHVYNVRKYSKDFKPDEFKCKCGGKYCSGYPTWIRADMVKFMQEVRDYYKRPVLITSGLRCSEYNKRVFGSSPGSKHRKGRACDYYIKWVTDTYAGRNDLMQKIKKFNNHEYSYGNTPNMGNAIHTQVK